MFKIKTALQLNYTQLIYRGPKFVKHIYMYFSTCFTRPNLNHSHCTGDFAYNLDSNDALVGDQFMRQIEPIAAYVPYMTTVGNHEGAYNFSNYVNRFTMPNTEDNMFYR